MATSINWVKVRDFATKHFETFVSLFFAAITCSIAPITFALGVGAGAVARFGFDKYKGKKQETKPGNIEESEKTTLISDKLRQQAVDGSFLIIDDEVDPATQEKPKEEIKDAPKEKEKKHQLLGYQVMANVGTYLLPTFLSHACAFGAGMSVGNLLYREFNNLLERRATKV
jgi:hypothetical protein